MPCEKSDFLLYLNDSQRISANLEQIYTAWLDTRRQMEMLPVSMYRASKEGTGYLPVKAYSNDNCTSKGARSQQTETQLAEFSQGKAELKARIDSFDAVTLEHTGMYRRLRLSSLPDRRAEILRQLDIEELL